MPDAGTQPSGTGGSQGGAAPPGDRSAAVGAATEAGAVGGTAAAPAADSGDGAPTMLPSPPSHATYAHPGSKAFLGGYRNKARGTIFHHATTQTDAPPRPPPKCEQAAAGVQTEPPHRSRAVQCPRDASTQCPRPGWAEDPAAGKMLEPTEPYQSGEQALTRRAAAAVAIQRHARGWLTRRAVAPRLRVRREVDAFMQEQEAKEEAAAEAARLHEVQRRMQPRTQADFVLLYDELAIWWGQEQAKIAAAEGMTDEERQAARQALLAKETKLLQTIDRLKLAAAPIVRAERAERQLAAAAAPRKWEGPSGRVMEVATPATLRAGELAGAYHALLAADGANLDARLAALLAVKYHAKGVDCSLTREIVGLVDREADLLNRGRDPVIMAGLRTRLANAFLEFVRSEQRAAAQAAAKPATGGAPQRRPSSRLPAEVQAN